MSDAGRPRRRPPVQPALVRKLLPTLERFPSAEPYLIGVSGGRDSVALLHALQHWLGYRRLIVCHLDHGLRPESVADAVFVSDLAARLACRMDAARSDVAALAKRRKISIETAAREARHHFFAEAAARHDCRTVFLAHHADDRVETLLFNLFRGTGAAGLAAMRTVTERRTPDGLLSLVRPLLGVWRRDIDAYLAHQALEFREDASNTDPQHTRNRVRHQIIPALEDSYGREFRVAVWRAAELLAAEDECLAGQVAPAFQQAELSTDEVSALPLALQRRGLHAWLRAHAVPDIGFDEVERVRGLLRSRRAKVNLPGGWHARRRAGYLFLENPGSA